MVSSMLVTSKIVLLLSEWAEYHGRGKNSKNTQLPNLSM